MLRTPRSTTKPMNQILEPPSKYIKGDISDLLIVDSSGTTLYAEDCFIVHKDAYSGEAVLSDSETFRVAEERGTSLRSLMNALFDRGRAFSLRNLLFTPSDND